jgi:hypothetical protein
MMDQLDVKTHLLEPLETAIVPSSTPPLIIRDLFEKNTQVRFSTVFAEFKRRFFDKTENPVAEATYRKFKLLQMSADGPIIAELGGESKVQGSFSAVFALLECQPNGEAGFLQTNGYANIFYAQDKKGTLCAIRVGWSSDGWVVDAVSVADPMAWHGEHLIFCPLFRALGTSDYCLPAPAHADAA